jgi:hypothetical protein
LTVKYHKVSIIIGQEIVVTSFIKSLQKVLAFLSKSLDAWITYRVFSGQNCQKIELRMRWSVTSRTSLHYIDR